ncbi:unnamed protein product [Nippostrongylus brasiliensis]|uniref:Uncharacterized protein n=1 Tax=Nippostrongylus brasiliensis TaxID=27835 RepID=A0A0N4YUQ8_NIPBR|nr:unnamed protein product [Nippostrongylus brasiliensis]
MAKLNENRFANGRLCDTEQANNVALSLSPGNEAQKSVLFDLTFSENLRARPVEFIPHSPSWEK